MKKIGLFGMWMLCLVNGFIVFNDIITIVRSKGVVKYYL